MAFELLGYAKRVAVRRAVYLLVAAVLAWVGIGRAEAQTYANCTSTAAGWNGTECPSKEAAISASRHAAEVYAADYSFLTVSPGYEDIADSGPPANWPAVRVIIYNSGVFQSEWWRKYPPGVECDDPDAVFNPATGECEAPKDCEAESNLGPANFVGAVPQICKASCVFEGKGACVGGVIDGVDTWTCSDWQATGASCSTGDASSPPNDADGDGSSDSNDPSPNNPGQGGGGKDGKPGEDGSQGTGTSGSGPGGGQGNGAGEGSGNGNTAGGGGNCASPPSVTGDAALAMIAYQTWATRCAIEGKGTGQGEGDGDDDGPGDSSAVPFNEGEEAEDDAEEPSEVAEHTFDVETLLDFSGFTGGGGSCPDFGSITMGPFGTHSLGGEWFCEWLPIFRALIILSATLTAIKILLGWN